MREWGRGGTADHQIPPASIRAAQSIAINGPTSLFVSSLKPRERGGNPCQGNKRDRGGPLTVTSLLVVDPHLLSEAARHAFIQVAHSFDNHRCEPSCVQQIDPN